jgi:hypothetical protein
MIFGDFGEQRVPFDRPAAATPGFMPRSLDTGFIPEFEPYPTVMLPQMARLPAGVHQPLTAEPGVLPSPTNPTTVAATPQQAPDVKVLKQRSLRMMPIPLLMALGIFPGPRGGVRSGLNPDRFVKGGRRPSGL